MGAGCPRLEGGEGGREGKFKKRVSLDYLVGKVQIELPSLPRFLPSALLLVVARDAANLMNAVLGHDPRERVADDGPEGGREGGKDRRRV